MGDGGLTSSRDCSKKLFGLKGDLPDMTGARAAEDLPHTGSCEGTMPTDRARQKFGIAAVSQLVLGCSGCRAVQPQAPPPGRPTVAAARTDPRIDAWVLFAEAIVSPEPGGPSFQFWKSVFDELRPRPNDRVLLLKVIVKGLG